MVRANPQSNPYRAKIPHRYLLVRILLAFIRAPTNRYLLLSSALPASR
jgi:hypothetical protein